MCNRALPPNLVPDAFQLPDQAQLPVRPPAHRPRLLLLYGSLRTRSHSRFLTFEAQRPLDLMGAETRVDHANGLPLPDDAPATHPKVVELRQARLWPEGQVWRGLKRELAPCPR